MSINPTDAASGARRRTSRRIGEILRDFGRLHEEDISQVMALQLKKGGRFGEVARRLRLIKEDDVQRALAHQFEYPYLPQGKVHVSPQLIAAYQPFSRHVEALRALRSQLTLRWFNEARRTIAFTGSRSGVGCSSLTANLAIVFAQAGQRTLLIDANFRRPQQQDLFGMKCGGGLCGCLSGRGNFFDALSPVAPFEDLSVLSAGAVPPNPNELLSQGSFVHVLETARANFDVVIIDTPAITQYADAQMVAARAGACILVTRRNQSRISEIERAKDMIAPSGAALLGTVIND